VSISSDRADVVRRSCPNSCLCCTEVIRSRADVVRVTPDVGLVSYLCQSRVAVPMSDYAYANPTLTLHPQTPHLLRHPNRPAFVEAVNAFEDHGFAFFQAFFNRYPCTFGRAELDEADAGLAIIKGINISTLRAELDSIYRDGDDILQRLQVEAGVYKLVGKQHIVFVGKLRLQTQSTGGCVNLVIQRKQFTSGQLVLFAAVPGLHG